MSTKPIAIVAPYRDNADQNREQHLQSFVPHMERFLGRLEVAHRILVVQQSDDGRKFNRGKLLNVGFELLEEESDHFIFSDIDLLPGDDLAGIYSRFPAEPIHIGVRCTKYSQYPDFFGGIVAFSNRDFRRINGFPNRYWGWGGEDDELFMRTNAAGLSIVRPESGTLLELPHSNTSLREEWRNDDKIENLAGFPQNWKSDGLSNLDYRVLDSVRLSSQTRLTVVEL